MASNLHPSTRPRVLIVGGGLGGLALASALCRTSSVQEFEVTLLEREQGPRAKSQGFLFGLRHEGFEALNSMGLSDCTEALRKTAHPPNPITTLTQTGRVLAQYPAPPEMQFPGGVTYICKATLRHMLAQSIPRGVMRYHSQVVSFQALPDNTIQLTLADGTKISGDVLVGADGPRSAVRSSWLGDSLHDTGLAVYGATVPYSPEISNIIRGSVLMLGNHCNMIATVHPAFQDNPHCQTCGELGFVFMFSFKRPAGLQVHSHSATKHHAIEVATADGWHPILVDALKKSELAHCRAVQLLDRPPLKETGAWPLGKVTLLGDAAHPMTPFLGVGGNSALVDAASLSKCLLDHTIPSIPDRLKAYEAEMFQRSSQLTRASSEACALYHRGGVSAVTRNVGIAVTSLRSSSFRRNLALAALAGIGAMASFN